MQFILEAARIWKKERMEAVLVPVTGKARSGAHMIEQHSSLGRENLQVVCGLHPH